MNRATCISQNFTSWTCQCVCGFTGARCESTVYECASNPCLNGGTCTKPTQCGFVCVCPQQPVTYYGPLCESRAPTPPNYNCIYSQSETLYFASPTGGTNNGMYHGSAAQLGKLRFSDAMSNIYSAYNAENINNRNVCPPDFILVGNSCYRVLANSFYDFDQAKSQCDALNSNLAWFTTAQDVDLVRSWLNSIKLTSDIWVGGKLIAGTWYWDLNDARIAPNILQSFWAPGKPSYNGAQQTAMLMVRSNGFLFANQDPSVALYSALCKKEPFVFDNSNTMLVPIAQEYAIDPNGRPLVGFKFITNVTNAGTKAISKVYSPTAGTYTTVFSQIPVHYGELYTGPVRKYSSPFSVVICGDLTHNQLEQARNAIRLAWLSMRPDLEACNCFDITFINIEKITDSSSSSAASSSSTVDEASSMFFDIQQQQQNNQRINTQLTYLGLTKDQVIEGSNSDASNSPNSNVIQAALNAVGLSTCYSRNGRSTLLDVVVAKPSLEQPEFDALER